jgi:hypothetical protein
LGVRYAFDVLFHELIHVSQCYRLGGGVGPTSHNNTAWIAEVNRLAPALGLGVIRAGLSKTRREPDGSERTPKTGKLVTKVVRASDGDVPHEVVARFPHALRCHLGTADAYYRSQESPVTHNYLLQPAAAS